MNGKKFENPQTANLHKILEDSVYIAELMKERNSEETQPEDTAEEGDKLVSKFYYTPRTILGMHVYVDTRYCIYQCAYRF